MITMARHHNDKKAREKELSASLKRQLNNAAVRRHLRSQPLFRIDEELPESMVRLLGIIEQQEAKRG